MNTNTDKNQDALDKCLREWRVDASLPPQFRDRVWQRIERGESSGEFSLREVFAVVISRFVFRPQLAFSYAALALVLGLALGYWQARADTSTAVSGLEQRYIQTVDPYHKPGHL